MQSQPSAAQPVWGTAAKRGEHVQAIDFSPIPGRPPAALASKGVAPLPNGTERDGTLHWNGVTGDLNVP
jgi:hypothetical protein